jgi:ABC-type antimicrobial peptide transport system permease subunit
LTVLGLIVAMGVFNTFLMSVLERTREFGVLQAIGMRPAHIARLVLAEGVVLGVVSIAIGTGLGAVLTWPLIEWGLDFSDALGESYTNGGVLASSVIYSAYNWPRMLVFAFGGFLLTVSAAVWPAWRVSQLSPVDALKSQ